MRRYDVAIVGLGAMGSAALHAIAARGQRVIGIDRFQLAGSRCSSFGESRIFRLAYSENPAYVPLLRDAYRAWRRLEEATGESVLILTGILEANAPGGTQVEGSLRSAQEHDLPHERLTPRQVSDRFPAFRVRSDWTCFFSPDGGVLFPEKAIGLFVALAQGLGATARLNTRVLEVQPAGNGVRIKLEDGEVIEAGSTIISAGPWIGELVPRLRHSLTLTRQPLLWFDPIDASLVRPDRMPVFLFQDSDDVAYGLPDVCGSGVKAAFHSSGGPLISADQPRAEVSESEERALRAFLQRYVPPAAGAVRRTSLCAYTRSPDSHFVLGLHPEAPQIVIASPCSGHGFKFASIIGEILADLALERSTSWPIEIFTPQRVLIGPGLAS